MCVRMNKLLKAVLRVSDEGHRTGRDRVAIIRVINQALPHPTAAIDDIRAADR